MSLHLIKKKKEWYFREAGHDYGPFDSKKEAGIYHAMYIALKKEKEKE